MHVETANADGKARSGAKRPATAIGAALIGAGVLGTLAAHTPMNLATGPSPVTPRPTVISNDLKLAANTSAATIDPGTLPDVTPTYVTVPVSKLQSGHPVDWQTLHAADPTVPANGLTDSGLPYGGYSAATVANQPIGQYSPNSAAYIPENLLQTVANVPAVEYEAINMVSAAFENSDNWWLYIPTNVVGFDQQDKQKFEGMTLMMVPVPLVAKANYDQWWLSLAANAPMTPNCTGIPGPCSDVFYFDQYGTVPTWKLIEGYTFPEIRNTIDPNDETYVTPNGKLVHIQPDWSGKTYKLDPFGPQKAIWQTLTEKPTGYKRAPTAGEWAKAFNRLGNAMWIGLNPNVEGTFCLPCQWAGTAVGAPGSLPKQYLFGEYYTFFDNGQKFTEHDWVHGRPDYDETKREDYVKVLNGMDPKVQRHLLQKAEEATTPKALRDSFDEFNTNMAAVGKLMDKNIQENIEGLERILNGPVPKSGNELIQQFNDSFRPGGSKHAARETNSKHALPETTAPTVGKRHATAEVTVSSKQATAPATTDFEVQSPAVTPAATNVKPAANPLDAIGQQVVATIEQAITPHKSPNVVRSSAHTTTMQTLIPGGRHQTVDSTINGKHRD